MNKAHKTAVLLLIICLLASIVVVMRRNKAYKTIVTHTHHVTMPDSQGDVIIKGGHLHEYSKNKVNEVIITAHKSVFSIAVNTLSCTQVICQIIYKTKHRAVINAQYALVDRKNKKIAFKGTVDGTFEEITLHGQNIVYNFETGIITTQHPITYIHPSGYFTAGTSSVDSKNKSIEMNNGIYSEFSQLQS